MATKGRRWFWKEEVADESGACYAVLFIEDGESRGVTFAKVYTHGDAEELIDAMKWQDAFRSGKGLFLPEQIKKPAAKTAKKKPPVRKASGARK